jgi:hypothetical protein
VKLSEVLLLSRLRENAVERNRLNRPPDPDERERSHLPQTFERDWGEEEGPEADVTEASSSFSGVSCLIDHDGEFAHVL